MENEIKNTPIRDEKGLFVKGNQLSKGHNRKTVKIANNFKVLSAKIVTEKKLKNLWNNLIKIAMDNTDPKTAVRATEVIFKHILPKPAVEADITVTQGLTQEQQMEIIKQAISKQLE
jgi:hypothetical protein